MLRRPGALLIRLWCATHHEFDVFVVAIFKLDVPCILQLFNKLIHDVALTLCLQLLPAGRKGTKPPFLSAMFWWNRASRWGAAETFKIYIFECILARAHSKRQGRPRSLNKRNTVLRKMKLS